MEFKNREGKNLNRKRLEVISQTPNQLIVDVFSEASNITEYGTPINAETLNTLQDEINGKLSNFESLLADKGATITVEGKTVSNVEFLSNPQDQLNLKLNRSELLDLVYPIGAIYLSVNSTSPATLFGGVWEVYGSGRTIVGQGTSDMTYNAGDTGGESKHTLTSSEMPTHNHSCLSAGEGGASFFFMAGKSGANLSTTGVLSSSTSNIDEDAASGGSTQTLNKIDLKIASHNHSIESRGSGLSHNNMPPYIVCYMWKRIG